jgi:hypothetical protein
MPHHGPVTGDLILQTREGGSQVLELISFHVPCNPAHRGAFLPVLQAHLELESGNRMHPARARQPARCAWRAGMATACGAQRRSYAPTQFAL